MLEQMTQNTLKPPSEFYKFGNMLDFVQHEEGEKYFDMQVAAMDDGRVAMFHSHPFKKDISWFEFDLSTNNLNFVLDDGNTRDIGMPLNQNVAKNMQNSHQILMVLMDPKTGDAKEGNYVPLIIHRS